ncbi:hypothetical protein MHTCC0001_13870 [Flavobacteriaceae bacterium MHTCC 0001]
MIGFFATKKNISIIFFIILLIDIIIKSYHETSLYRIITKSLLILVLIAYCIAKSNEHKKRHILHLVVALTFFLAGDIFMLFYKNATLYLIAISCFICGKIFYILRFITNQNFDIRRMSAYLVLIFLYVLAIFFLIFENLNDLNVCLVILYMFVAVKALMFALARKGAVVKSSYSLVLYGVFFSILSDSITSLGSFYNDKIPYDHIAIMLFYGFSQYFIVMGLIEDKNNCFFRYRCKQFGQVRD